MKPVHADDVAPERPWQSPKHVLIRLGAYILTFGAIVVAIRWLGVPVWVVLTLGVIIFVALVAVDIARWRRQRRL